jgi:hypothetical protein
MFIHCEFLIFRLLPAIVAGLGRFEILDKTKIGAFLVLCNTRYWPKVSIYDGQVGWLCPESATGAAFSDKAAKKIFF